MIQTLQVYVTGKHMSCRRLSDELKAQLLPHDPTSTVRTNEVGNVQIFFRTICLEEMGYDVIVELLKRLEGNAEFDLNVEAFLKVLAENSLVS